MEKAFISPREKLVTPPVLGFPRFDVPFVVETDASSTAIGAVLSQEQADGKIQPVLVCEPHDEPHREKLLKL